MTASRKLNSPYLTQSEWDEMQVLRKAISYSPSTVSPMLQERFADLFARSLLDKESNTPDHFNATPFYRIPD
jgi:hypothetical protein